MIERRAAALMNCDIRFINPEELELSCCHCTTEYFDMSKAIAYGMYTCTGEKISVRSKFPTVLYNPCRKRGVLSIRREILEILMENLHTGIPRHLQFIGWDDRGVFKLHCGLHGDFQVRPDKIVKNKPLCPGCRGKNQKEGYLNLILDGDTTIGLKFGVSQESNKRLIQQNSKNALRMENFGVWLFEGVDECLSAEKQCKKELECGVLSKRELEDGHTETTHIKNLDRIIEIYENHGGKRISTDEER